MKFYIEGLSILQIKERSKFWPLTGQNLFQKKYETTNQKSIKLSSMLPILEGICEMGHHQQNLTLTSSLKMINVHYVALLLDLTALYSRNFFLLCSRLTVNFLSIG